MTAKSFIEENRTALKQIRRVTRRVEMAGDAAFNPRRYMIQFCTDVERYNMYEALLMGREYGDVEAIAREALK